MTKPVDTEVLRAAAIDSCNWTMLATTILAHPRSREIPAEKLKVCGVVAFEPGEPTGDQVVGVLAACVALDLLLAGVA